MTARKKVQAGDRLAIPARTWNDLIDIADAWGEGRVSALTPDGVGLGKNVAVVMAKNSTGSGLKRNSVVHLKDAIADPAAHENSFRQRVQMIAEAPTEDRQTPIAITLSQVPDDKMVACAVAGAVPVQLNMLDAGHTTCVAKDGITDSLDSADGGDYPILYAAGTSGLVWGYILLSSAAAPGEAHPAYTKTAITAGSGGPDDRTLGTGTVDLYDKQSSGDVFGTPVRTDVAIKSFWSIEIPASRWIWASQGADGSLYIVSEDCDDTGTTSALAPVT